MFLCLSRTVRCWLLINCYKLLCFSSKTEVFCWSASSSNPINADSSALISFKTCRVHIFDSNHQTRNSHLVGEKVASGARIFDTWYFQQQFFRSVLFFGSSGTADLIPDSQLLDWQLLREGTLSNSPASERACGRVAGRSSSSVHAFPVSDEIWSDPRSTFAFFPRPAFSALIMFALIVKMFNCTSRRATLSQFRA